MAGVLRANRIPPGSTNVPAALSCRVVGGYARPLMPQIARCGQPHIQQLVRGVTVPCSVRWTSSCDSRDEEKPSGN
jgi:hypothetical protein